LAALPVAAQPVTDAEFKGTAHIGSATRDVAARFSCAMERGKINNLAIEIDIPATESLTSTFDFNAFEGPTGIGGQHHVAATAGKTQARIDFASTGSYGNNGAPASTFTFSAAMTPDSRSSANLHRLQAVVATLASGASQLNYSVANPRPGGPPIEATIDLTDADAARMKSAVSRCLTTR
jgi:hypothetical protein